jgi:hypothetical protein
MVIDSTDINRLHLAEQELHQMMESDVRLFSRNANPFYMCINFAG